MKNTYLVLKNKHRDEIKEFPMIFAFSQNQLKEGLQKMGLKETEKNKLLSIGAGGFIRKSDKKDFLTLISKQNKELNDSIFNDKEGVGFIKDMFSYELSNHEYSYTRDLTDTLDALNLTQEQINKNKSLVNGLSIAIKEVLSFEQ